MKNILNSIINQPLSVIDTSILIKDYIPISISSENKNLDFDISSSKAWEAYINQYLQENKGNVAYGGYLEKRNIYGKSTYFTKEKESDVRNIHLGIDLWTAVETPVLAILNGEIHSFKNNKNHGDYGPTIILKHQVNNENFYSLYGHLSENSIQNIAIGDKVNQGQQIGILGNSSVNGDYAPHLHFQIIKDLQGNFGDYPGVCSQNTLEFYQENCPNPNLLLKLPNEI